MMKNPLELLLPVARNSIINFLKGEKYLISDQIRKEIGFNHDFQGIFVTLKKGYISIHGAFSDLRGCIGRHQRLFPNIADEVAQCAILSATEDTRFPPVNTQELNDIKIEISLLSKPELVTQREQLDPHKYGVMVEQGLHKATLLPEIEGVDTVSKQLEIVKRKAGIRSETDLKIYRFSVLKIKE